MNEKGPKRTPWWRYSDQPPSARFLWWVRGVILVAWAIVLFLGVPNTVREANRIRASRPPGVARSQELRDLVVETVILYVAVPFVVLGIFGFGVVPRHNSPMTGRPLFDVLWRSHGRARRQTEHRD